MKVRTNNIPWTTDMRTVEEVARQLHAECRWIWQASVNGVAVNARNLSTLQDATDEVASALAAGEWYWHNGSAYCPACVECDSPAIDSDDPCVTRGRRVSHCTCCQTDYAAE